MARIASRLKPAADVVPKVERLEDKIETSTPFVGEPVESKPAEAVATSTLVITDPVRQRIITLESEHAAKKAYLSVTRRLGRIRRANVSYELDGEHIVDADHAHWVKSTEGATTEAYVVFITKSGLIKVPMASEARAVRMARDSSIRLLSGREAVIEGAIDGDHAIFHAYGVRVELT